MAAPRDVGQVGEQVTRPYTSRTFSIAEDVNDDGYADDVTMRVDFENDRFVAASVENIEWGTPVRDRFQKDDNVIYRNGNNYLLQQGKPAWCGSYTGKVEMFSLKVSGFTDKPGSRFDGHEIKLSEGLALFLKIVPEVKLEGTERMFQVSSCSTDTPSKAKAD